MAATKVNNRWTRMNDNFRKQIEHFEVETRMKPAQIAKECGISAASMYNYMRDCAHMTKLTERYLIQLFERHGMKYDPTLGEGVNA